MHWLKIDCCFQGGLCSIWIVIPNTKALIQNWELNKTKVALIIAALLGISLYIGSTFLKNSGEYRDVEIFAHRGAAAGMSKEVAVMSLKPEQVTKIKALRPEWKSGILLSQVLGDLSKMDVDSLAVNLGMMHPSFIKRTHDVGKKLYVWTADDPVTIFKMLMLGVDGIIINEPEMARKVLDVRNDLKPVERFILHTAVILGKDLPTKAYRDDSP